MTDRRPLTLRTDVTPNRLQEMPAGDLLPPDTLANALLVVLQGLVTNTSAGITPTDTVLQAMGKLQAQVDSLANATGQALATMSSQVSGKVDKDSSKVLSDNNFTNTERVKLSNIGDGASNDRSKHTGTQTLATISNAGTAAAATVTTTPSDTTAGRLLKVGDFGIGAASAPFYNGIDLNTLKISGTYGVLYPVNGPGVSDIATLVIAAHSPDWLTQTYHANEPWETYQRFFYSGNAWSPWKLIAPRTGLGAASTRDATNSQIDTRDVLMAVGYGGLGRTLDLRTSRPDLHANMPPSAFFGRGTISGLADGYTLGIPGLISGNYGVITIHCHWHDVTAIGAMRMTFEVDDLRWYRFASNADAWSPWRQSINAAQIGSLPIASGGAMESGSNANGYYFRYANGHQVCILSHAVFLGSGSEPADTIRTYSWTFPAPFYETPTVNANAKAFGKAAVFLGNDNGQGISGTVAPSLIIKLLTTGVGDLPMALIAEGRWKNV